MKLVIKQYVLLQTTKKKWKEIKKIYKYKNCLAYSKFVASVCSVKRASGESLLQFILFINTKFKVDFF